MRSQFEKLAETIATQSCENNCFCDELLPAFAPCRHCQTVEAITVALLDAYCEGELAGLEDACREVDQHPLNITGTDLVERTRVILLMSLKSLVGARL